MRSLPKVHRVRERWIIQQGDLSQVLIKYKRFCPERRDQGLHTSFRATVQANKEILPWFIRPHVSLNVCFIFWQTQNQWHKHVKHQLLCLQKKERTWRWVNDHMIFYGDSVTEKNNFRIYLIKPLQQFALTHFKYILLLLLCTTNLLLSSKILNLTFMK